MKRRLNHGRSWIAIAVAAGALALGAGRDVRAEDADAFAAFTDPSTPAETLLSALDERAASLVGNWPTETSGPVSVCSRDASPWNKALAD